jgi:hypothetical protein
LWVSLVSFATITLCVVSQRVFIVVYFVIHWVRKLFDTPSCILTYIHTYIQTHTHTRNVMDCIDRGKCYESLLTNPVSRWIECAFCVLLHNLPRGNITKAKCHRVPLRSGCSLFIYRFLAEYAQKCAVTLKYGEH